MSSPSPYIRCPLGEQLLSRCLALALLPCALSAGSAQAPQHPVPAPDNPPAFEVVAVKLARPDDPSHGYNSTTDRLSFRNYTLRDLIQTAYRLKSKTQVLSRPDWIDKQPFDITAKIDDADVARMHSMTREDRLHERDRLLQSLLADRFQLKAQLDHRAMPIFALVQTKSGARLTPTSSDPTNDRHSMRTSDQHMTASGITMETLANYLSNQPETGGRLVLDRSGLAAEYDFKLDWTPDRGTGVPPDAQFPGLFTALQEQLGLRLEPQKDSIPVVIVDSAAKPTID